LTGGQGGSSNIRPVNDEEEDEMPEIVITADRRDSRRGPEVMRERVAASDLESDMFAAHLVERIGWALSDADTLEDQRRERSERRPSVVPAG
jgi:hypothetical protein